MYKLGYTSGLAEAKCDEGKNTIKCVGDIVDKLAKKCEDVPKKMTMPSKITEVTDGCFSSAQIVKVCDEFSGNQSSDESQSEADSEAEEACDKAAKTSGSCGGGKSSKTHDKKDQSCKKSCCGGKSSSKNQRTGSKLVNMNVPTTIGDILASGVDEMIGNTNLTESQFKHLYCDNTPYPECETCPYNSKTFQNIERDIWSLFNMIDDAINELMCGRYDLANSMFRCPGQLNSLLRASLGPLGEVAAAAVTGSLIALTAARGAMAAFEGIATSARYTDFRREVMYSCGRLIKSGSLVGLPRQYASAINGILTDIGCSANTLCRITSKSGSARSSCFGNGYNLWGERPSGRKCVSEPYKSSGRPIATEDSKTKAEKALKIVDKSLKAAEDVEDNPYVAEVQDANEPTTRHKTYTETEDRVAESGKTYYRDVIDPKTGKTKKVKIPVSDGTDLEIVKHNLGSVFEIEDNGLTVPDPTTETSDVKVVKDKRYVVRDPVSGRMLEIREIDKSIKPGDAISTVKEKISRVFDTSADEINVGDFVAKTDKKSGFELTKDKEARTDVIYYQVNDQGEFVNLPLTPGAAIPTGTYVKMIMSPGAEGDAIVYTGSNQCVLDNGLIIRRPIFLDAGSHDMAVDTTALITKTGVLAGEMANIETIGLTENEIKTAYILDSEANMSVVPNDVEFERIPTILDTIADND